MAHHQRSLWKGVLMGKIIAVGNLKGGTGKSTIAVNLACGLAERTGAVALIDADPQGTATAWLRDGPPPGLHLLSLPLAGAAGNAPWTDRIVGQRRRQDLVVLDLPPQMGECFEAALRIADLLVIPLTLSEVDLHATAQALAVLHRVQAVRKGPPSCLLVPSKVDRRTSVGRQARSALVRLGWQVGPALGQRAAHSDAFKATKWIGAHAPGTAAHLEVHALVRAVEDQLARCKEPVDEYLPAFLDADAGMAAPAGLECRPGAPIRIGAFCLSLMGAMLSKLRPGEQQAFH
jgi:chromosome partitioning protein